MVDKLKIVWGKKAKSALQAMFDYIKLDSLQNAEKVRDAIIDSASALNQNFVHRPDKYKKNNDGTYRAKWYQQILYLAKCKKGCFK